MPVTSFVLCPRFYRWRRQYHIIIFSHHSQQDHVTPEGSKHSGTNQPVFEYKNDNADDTKLGSVGIKYLSIAQLNNLSVLNLSKLDVSQDTTIWAIKDVIIWQELTGPYSRSCTYVDKQTIRNKQHSREGLPTFG